MTFSAVVRASVASSLLLGGGATAVADPVARETMIDPRAFRRIPRESGPDDYYKVEGAGPDATIHALYRPPMETTVLGYAIPDERRRAVRKLRWRWRADVLPRGGDECADGKGDSAAVVYVSWRRALRWYTLKYVWSAVSPRGKTCDQKRNPFVAQDTVIVDSGPSQGQWRTVEIDPDLEYRRHFEGGDLHAGVPDLLGLAIMTDGDQTRSPSEAEYGGFVIGWK